MTRAPSRRSASSARWLERQHKDPYVAAAAKRGYRSRAAFKLSAIDDGARVLKPGSAVVDLGAAPGGWTQVAVERTRPQAAGGRVVAVDLGPIAPIEGAMALELDAADPDAGVHIQEALGRPADVVLSDMAPPATGHRATDQARSAALAEAALAVALDVLGAGGTLLVKILQGPGEVELAGRMKRHFAAVRHVKPPASRSESREIYLLATGFLGPRR